MNEPINNSIYDDMDDIKIPFVFIYPISNEIMIDPVIATDGITYDKANII